MLDLLFETSWEVCNRVGGIYAVLSTKARTLQELYKDNVIFIGPDLWSASNPSPFFVEGRTPLDAWRRKASLPMGIKVRVGRWNVPGKPLVVLVDYHSLFPFKNEFYADMWNRFQVDSLHGYGDYDESCMFALASAMVIESIVNNRQEKKPTLQAIAHFDEWTTGMGLLYVKAHLPQVATVFTTHATSIGRSISGNGKPLYDYMPGYHGDQMAQELNMESKHSLEKIAAHQADVFTTVSEVTARECEQLLERRPLVTPNAFEQDFVPQGAARPRARRKARRRLLDVAQALTGDTLDDNTMMIATSGRCEFRNKGIDAYLDAINVLRGNIDRVASLQRKIVAWVLVPGWVSTPRGDLQQALKQGNCGRLFNPVITHNLHNTDSDVIYRKINDMGMHNELDDMLKVIYVPSYLNGDDGIMNMSYYELLSGLDLTAFPSYYEPWGYTPLESIAFGVPTITTDLAGFGQWVLDNRGDDPKHSGVRVLHRNDSNYHDTVHAVAGSMLNAYMATDTEVRRLTRAARDTAAMAVWSNFINAYVQAYDLALEAAQARRPAPDEF